MSARNIIIYAAAALLLAVSASSCDPGKEGPVATARIETAASTSLGSAKTSLFLSVTAGGAWSIELRYPSGAGGWASVSPSASTTASS